MLKKVKCDIGSCKRGRVRQNDFKKHVDKIPQMIQKIKTKQE